MRSGREADPGLQACGQGWAETSPRRPGSQARESGAGPGAASPGLSPPLFWSVSSLEVARMGSSTWPADRVSQILWGPEHGIDLVVPVRAQSILDHAL